ncbi:MAG: hypothetical protein AAFX03_08610 [Pseudomonadota bacterium]
MSFDRKISIALIFAVLVETAGGLIWAGAAAERLERLDAEASVARAANARLTRVEAELDAVRAQLDRIEARLAE